MPVCFSVSSFSSSLNALLEYTNCRDNDLHLPELGCTLSASRAEGTGGMHSTEVAPMVYIK